jgi:hypothetical protein
MLGGLLGRNRQADRLRKAQKFERQRFAAQGREQLARNRVAAALGGTTGEGSTALALKESERNFAADLRQMRRNHRAEREATRPNFWDYAGAAGSFLTQAASVPGLGEAVGGGISGLAGMFKRKPYQAQSGLDYGTDYGVYP